MPTMSRVPPPPPIEPVKKSVGERLADVVDEIYHLEEKRRELLIEEAKQETREDEDFLEEVHKDCVTKDDLRAAEKEAESAAEDRARAEEAREYLREFGGHTRTCLSGALAATQALHPLCTCGWNHVATEIEKA